MTVKAVSCKKDVFQPIFVGYDVHFLEVIENSMFHYCSVHGLHAGCDPYQVCEFPKEGLK